MSQLTQAAALLDAIKQDCIDAWGLTNAKVEYGQVRLAPTAVPYAVIDLLPVAQDFQSANQVEQHYIFRITGRFAFPATGNVLLEKITNANLLVAQLITGARYAGIAYLPIVTEYSFEEEDDPQKRVYELAVTFECKVSQDHH